MEHAFTTTLIERARALKKRIVLPECEDTRTLKAAQQLAREQICKVVLVGDPSQIAADAKSAEVDLSGCQVLNPQTAGETDLFADRLYALRKHKNLSFDEATRLIRTPLYFATMLLKEGHVDGYVAGASHTTADNLRPGLQILKTAPGVNTVSSFFLMIHPSTRWGENGLMLFADCAMVQHPTAEQLSDIAIASAHSFLQLDGTEPRVAMLSYSTKGSAQSEEIEKVVKATSLIREKAPDLAVDGEMQADAALIPEIASRKCGCSAVAGRANCLIFPDLNSGNISYKLTERLGGAQAIGPIVQGMSKSAHDLSRGCSVNDIVMVSAIAAIMSN